MGATGAMAAATTVGAEGVATAACCVLCAWVLSGASFFVSQLGLRLNAPAVPMASTPAATSVAFRGLSFIESLSCDGLRGRFRMPQKIGATGDRFVRPGLGEG
jgi:hypothetical protein